MAEEIKRQWILPKRRPLTCSELPRRLFRTIDVAEPIHPLLDYLMNTYSPSPNSHKGYPLCRAVLTSNITLISYLLDHNANPAVHGALPVRLATQTGRLDLVKLLVESPPDTSPSKKFKRDDRIPIGPELVELAMKSGHEHIVQYFVHDKGESLAMGHLLIDRCDTSATINNETWGRGGEGATKAGREGDQEQSSHGTTPKTHPEVRTA